MIIDNLQLKGQNQKDKGEDDMFFSADENEKRKRMIREQLERRGIEQQAVLKSMREVPRHLFVPDKLRTKAYHDRPLPIEEGQTISQPYIVALMIEALELEEDDRVLEIGTGSGYAAAVLVQIVAEVYTIERHQSLVELAQQRFEMLGYDNLEVKVGDGTEGWGEFGPYDGIIVAAGAPMIPESLAEQLKIGGRLVIPVGDRDLQELLVLTKQDDGGLKKERIAGVRFVPLVGEKGWEDEG
ncbi:protein-L-isoaspartate(D-aspartate) O-methyltransferase [Natroniella acetigena]|uniref:protein-L-isoaspartate(D-aspartate) O-methyltransferase n=1 Tax=Natroniella acetigena TaxID=52004 RepID=UPI00200B2603|nr:protein-L-isoaspartate(D-aspartate) O-methyltransferase [Natroniella acetigena]MCK8826344.1 protein-L-isoaspartate(D-aspartate) O-methyltransferase [Natroniella acetigena]